MWRPHRSPYQRFNDYLDSKLDFALEDDRVSLLGLLLMFLMFGVSFGVGYCVGSLL